MFGDFPILPHRMVEVGFKLFLLLILTCQTISGAFLIPYFTLYFLIGAPLYYMELALGQFTSRGPSTGFVLARGWQGKNCHNRFALIIDFFQVWVWL
jgi:SNF family Na+-dependent transporter